MNSISKTTRALVLGSEGNVGKPLASYLEACGYQVRGMDIRPGYRERYSVADINHPLDMLEAFDWQPEVVFILSAMVSRVTCEQASSLAVATNLEGINNVLTLCKRVKAKVVFFSTSEVYGPDIAVMDESLPDPKPNNRYGLTKLLGEKLVEYEVREYGLQAVILRPFMIYDENEDMGDHRSAMIRFAYNLAHRMPIEVHRGSVRGWLHVSDAVRAIERAAHLDEYAVINLGNPDLVSIESLARMIARELDADETLIHFSDLPERMTLKKKPRLEKQRDLLGISPEITLQEGVRRVCGRIRKVSAGAALHGDGGEAPESWHISRAPAQSGAD